MLKREACRPQEEAFTFGYVMSEILRCGVTVAAILAVAKVITLLAS